jgi:uncharacterized protein involved in type VI secretion and phage assembly
MTVQMIVESVFEASGFRDYRFSLTATYDPREYCVQYRETDFNFVSRLLEQFGMFYYFEHEKDKHTLVIVDSESMLKPRPDRRLHVTTPVRAAQIQRTWSLAGRWMRMTTLWGRAGGLFWGHFSRGYT